MSPEKSARHRPITDEELSEWRAQVDDYGYAEIADADVARLIEEVHRLKNDQGALDTDHLETVSYGMLNAAWRFLRSLFIGERAWK